MSSSDRYSPAGAALFGVLQEVERLREGPARMAGRLSVLRELARLGSATASELARARHASRQATQRIADDLLARGWLARRANPGDRRAPLLELTPTGRLSFDGLRKEETLQLNRLAAGLDPAALQSTRRLLRTLQARTKNR